MSDKKCVTVLLICLGILLIILAAGVAVWMDAHGFWIYPLPIENGTPPDMLPSMPVYM